MLQDTAKIFYICDQLIDAHLLSHKTLRSDNFEKFTYNANMFFQNSLRGTYKYFFGRKFLDTVLKWLLSPNKTFALCNL